MASRGVGRITLREGKAIKAISQQCTWVPARPKGVSSICLRMQKSAKGGGGNPPKGGDPLGEQVVTPATHLVKASLENLDNGGKGGDEKVGKGKVSSV